MYDFGKIQFIQEHENAKIAHEIRGDASLDEVVEAFEYFLKGCGYHLPDGKHIGYEYDEDDSDLGNCPECGMIEGTHKLDCNSKDKGDALYEKSEYYWDVDRNR